MTIGGDYAKSSVMMTDKRTARQHLLMIANPMAGGAGSTMLREIVAHLQGIGCKIRVHETSTLSDLRCLIDEAGGEPIDAIAVAGGDGTINRVLNALPEKAPPLAILPLGTINLLAREIGLPKSIAGIAETAAFGPSRPITVGDVNGQRFAIVASVGLDAEVVAHVNLGLKRHIGKWAYLYETLKRAVVSSPEPFRFRLNDREHQAHGIVVANGRHYAGAFVTSPEAHLEKHSFEVCQLTRPGRLAALRYLTSLIAGRFAQRAD
ncbi:MAG: diacylglycerol kinase family protein, partial [Pseudomonadota bacterium]